MTKEQINIAIAESLGWSIFHRNDKGEIKSWKHPDGSIWQEPWVPLRFTEDLNAMHEAWCSLTLWQHQAFRHELQAVIAYAQEDEEPHKGPCHSVCNATALQRAEAYLRTIGKWKDE